MYPNITSTNIKIPAVNPGEGFSVTSIVCSTTNYLVDPDGLRVDSHKLCNGVNNAQNLFYKALGDATGDEICDADNTACTAIASIIMNQVAQNTIGDLVREFCADVFDEIISNCNSKNPSANIEFIRSDGTKASDGDFSIDTVDLTSPSDVCANFQTNAPGPVQCYVN